MGKEWHWGGGRSSKSDGGGGGGGAADRKSINNAPSGCMCSVFQLFDFHQFQFPSSQQQQQQQPPSLNSKLEPFLPEVPPKGAEAPRNSLELDQPSSPTTIKEDEILNIPMDIQIKTNGDASSKAHGGALNDSSSSEISSSPSTKTPSLVARLMGLDLLPDQSYSPTSSVSTPNATGKSHLNHHYGRRPSLHSKLSNQGDLSGTRSLPETPRISSARRSDVEHRLSLQINKENISPSEELVLSRFSSLKRKELRTEEENRSPGHYARQIVKQVKESVSRRVGQDITNTAVRSRDHEAVNQLKSKKIMTKLEGDESSPGKASCSRLKFLEPKNKDQHVSPPLKPPVPAVSLQVNIMPQKTKPPAKTKYTEYRHQQQTQKRPINKCKKAVEERFGPPTRLKKPPQTSEIIRNKQEEPFVSPTAATRSNIPDKKCKKTPLSNDLLNISTVPTLLPIKKDPTPPATKIPQKQALANIAQESKRSSQLSSCSSHSYRKQEAMHNTILEARGKNEDRSNGAAAAATTITGDGKAAAEFEYITRILKRTGIEKDTPVSFTWWFSPSHPLDPSIFYYLEYFSSREKCDHRGQMSHRCNRKLIFHLVDEIMAEILKPFMNMKPWANSSASHNIIKGSNLIDTLCSKVRSFPCADCRVLEDIDALIDKDMPPLKAQCEVAFGEEGEGIVTELEKDLLDSLMRETAVIFYGKG